MKKRFTSKLIFFTLSMLVIVGVMMFVAVNSFAAVSKVNNETALFNAVKNGGDIQLSKSIVITDCLVIPEGKTVTLDLNGMTVDRALRSVETNGSVICVEKGAELVIKDTGYKNYGKITGGFAYNGGGICNYGTLTLAGGTVSSNKALDSSDGCGGGIYNGDGAVLNLVGGVIENNQARCGGGIYNATGGTVNIEQGSYKVTELSQLKTYYTNVSVTNNKASSDGNGIYNCASLNVKDSPKLTGNIDGMDIFFAYGKVMTFTGKFNPSGKIGVKAIAKGVPFTADYTKYVSKTPAEVFTPFDSTYTVKQTGKNGEVMLYNSAKTLIEVYTVGSDNKISSDKLADRIEYDTPQKAWDKVKGVAAQGKRVVMTLGSDWEHDEELVVKNSSCVDIDLNGHYIKRTRNHTRIDNGGVFRIKDESTLFIHDSNPGGKGYDGIKGGVITGGASENSGGGFTLDGKSCLYMDGGTLYECTSCKNGGGILCNEEGRVELNNCRIYFCQTVDSTDECHGGGIYAYFPIRLSVTGCIIQDCYSEDNGGGIYFEGDGNWNNILMISADKFIGNNCYDYGGAVYMKVSRGAYIDKCLFSTNSSYDDGGAVFFERYTDTQNKPDAIMIRDTKFTYNSCKDGGAAIFAEGDDVVLVNDTITNNHSGIGAVWLGADAASYGYDISVSGLTVIKDNTADKEDHHGIVLNDLGSTHNYIYCAGLYEGSHIDFSVNDSGNKEAVRNVSEYQKQYFHNTVGTLSFEKEEEVEAPLVTGTVFGRGKKAVVSFIGVAFIAIAATFIYKKKSGGADGETAKK